MYFEHAFKMNFLKSEKYLEAMFLLMFQNVCTCNRDILKFNTLLQKSTSVYRKAKNTPKAVVKTF